MVRYFETAEGRCGVCQGTGFGDVEHCAACFGHGQRMTCPDCRQTITGCVWNEGRCLSCHEDALLPIGPYGVDETGESWSDVYAGTSDDY